MRSCTRIKKGNTHTCTCHLWIFLENVSSRPHREANLTCPDISQFRMTCMYMCDPKEQGAIHSDPPHAHDAAATQGPSMSILCSVLELFFEKNSGQVPAPSWRGGGGGHLRLEMLARTGGHGSARHARHEAFGCPSKGTVNHPVSI
jgi:hypothetical protein